MSKAIVVITRIYGENEFDNYFELEGSLHQVEDRPIHFFNGNEFCVKNEVSKPIKEEILAHISSTLAEYFENDEELYVCYHPGQGTFNITKELKKLERVTLVIKYSSVGGPEMNSSQVKNILLNPDPESDIDDIIESVFGTKLQQKLNLLHECLTPEGAQTALDNFDEDYQQLDENVKADIKDLIKLNQNSFGKDYIDKLTNIRDQLLNA